MQLVELLSVRAPSPEKKLKLLKEIAEEHELEWDPSPSESELFKSHDDLLVSNATLQHFEIFSPVFYMCPYFLHRMDQSNMSVAPKFHFLKKSMTKFCNLLQFKVLMSILILMKALTN